MAGRCIETTNFSDIFITDEVPIGLINSLNTEYELANDPATGTVKVNLNGSLQLPGVGNDYTIIGKDISFTKAPRTNSGLVVSYIKD